MFSDRSFSAEAKALFELPFSSAAAIPLPTPALYLGLVPAKDRELLQAYVFYLFLLSRRGLRQKGRHPKSFNLLYRAVSRTWPGRTLLGFLQKEFIARNLSLSLLLEPLDGFEWLSKNRYPLEFSAASPIWLQVISPFSRLVAVLNNQTPPFYQPFTALAFVYAAVYVLAMPAVAAALEKARVSVDVVSLRRSLPLQQKETLQLFAAASGFLFRLKTGFFVGLSRRLIRLLPDVSASAAAATGSSFATGSSVSAAATVGSSSAVCSPASAAAGSQGTAGSSASALCRKINFFVYVNAFLYGLWHTLITRNKTRDLHQL